MRTCWLQLKSDNFPNGKISVVDTNFMELNVQKNEPLMFMLLKILVIEADHLCQ